MEWIKIIVALACLLMVEFSTTETAPGKWDNGAAPVAREAESRKDNQGS